MSAKSTGSLGQLLKKISFTNYFHRPDYYFFNWTDKIEGLGCT